MLTFPEVGLDSDSEHTHYTMPCLKSTNNVLFLIKSHGLFLVTIGYSFVINTYLRVCGLPNVISIAIRKIMNCSL